MSFLPLTCFAVAPYYRVLYARETADHAMFRESWEQLCPKTITSRDHSLAALATAYAVLSNDDLRREYDGLAPSSGAFDAAAFGEAVASEMRENFFTVDGGKSVGVVGPLLHSSPAASGFRKLLSRLIPGKFGLLVRLGLLRFNVAHTVCSIYTEGIPIGVKTSIDPTHGFELSTLLLDFFSMVALGVMWLTMEEVPLLIFAGALVLELLRYLRGWPALLDTALDKATQLDVFAAIQLLQIALVMLHHDHSRPGLAAECLQQSYRAVLLLFIFRFLRDSAIGFYQAARGERALQETAKFAATTAAFVAMVLLVSLGVAALNYVLTVGLLLGYYRALLPLLPSLRHSTAFAVVLGGTFFARQIQLHLNLIALWRAEGTRSLRLVRQRMLARPVPPRPPEQADVCPICHELLLQPEPLHPSAVEDGDASDSRPQRLELECTSSSAPPSEPPKPFVHCRWGCGQAVHDECMQAWRRGYRNECVICQTWWS